MGRFCPQGERWRLLRNNIGSSPDFLWQLLLAKFAITRHEHVGSPLETEAALWGGYRADRGACAYDSATVSRRVRELFYCGDTPCAVTLAALADLRAMDAALATRGIELVLLETPVHPAFAQQVPQRFQEVLDSVVRVERWELLRLEDVPLEELDYLPDGDHVSPAGAAKVTAALQQRLLED